MGETAAASSINVKASFFILENNNRGRASGWNQRALTRHDIAKVVRALSTHFNKNNNSYTLHRRSGLAGTNAPIT
jgi:hypothetical protein